MTRKVVTVVGARPQFIKAAVVSREFQRVNEISELLIHTGQHYDPNMSDLFFRELGIPQPKYNLQIGSGSHGLQTGRMLEQIERVLIEEKPDWVLVYGDTNSTLAGTLAACKLHIPVAHVEAGLRSFNRHMPEEINRVLTDHASDLLFPPTESALDNLRAEGIPKSKCSVVGDVMLDAALFYGRQAENVSRVLEAQRLSPGDYVLATIHRAENTDDLSRLSAIVGGLGALAKDIPVVLPVHPRTRKILQECGLTAGLAEVRLLDPLGYLDMVMLEKHARMIVTDSGGVQKEAFFHRVPCVTLRDETEWVELVELGWNLLVPPTSPDRVIAGIRTVLGGGRGSDASPFGDGHAGVLIARALGDQDRG